MEDNKINNNGIMYVDLDLPSGTLWSTKNVGANKPNNAGFYFQWGEVTGYNQWSIRFDNTCDGLTWSNYKWYLCGHGYDDTVKFKKYTKPGDTLELEDDAAHKIMGGDWHIPSPEQIQELIDNTTSTWTKLDDVIGMTFTSKKDSSKSIFIPAAGCALNRTIYNRESAGYIWSSALKNGKHSYDGNILKFWPGHATLDSYDRVYGLPIRGVIDGKCDNSEENKTDMEVNKDLNLIEVLKCVSREAKLWSPYCGECSFDGMRYDNELCIRCVHGNEVLNFFSDGRLSKDGECMLFPSKDNRDWSTFKVPTKIHKQFKPFQKVLVKDWHDCRSRWVASTYSHYDTALNKHYLTVLLTVNDEDIIPYEGNEDKLDEITDESEY
jgi:hypothetical protein